MNLTNEQSAIVEAVRGQNHGVIAVNAVAGSGKTHTCHAIVNAIRPKNGFYTAFNRGIVQDSKNRFGHLVNCATMHSMAYRHVKPKRDIRDLTYDDIEEDIGYDSKQWVLEKVNGFFLSDSLVVSQYLQPYSDEPDYQYASLVAGLVNQMADGRINPTFGYLLKALHYDLANGYENQEYDLLMLDEAQDTTGVMLGIFKALKAKRKVILGDRYQNIYSFMKTVNAFRELEVDQTLRLTRSFRCSEKIAEAVDEYGKKYLDSEFCYTGNTSVAEKNDEVYLSRSNYALIEIMLELMKKGKNFHTLRSMGEIFSLPIALVMVKAGKYTRDKRYSYLNAIYDDWIGYRQTPLFAFIAAELPPEDPAQGAMKLLDNLARDGINIFDLRKKVEEMKPDKSRILSTVHSYKGLEADTVHIADDLNDRLKKVESDNDELSQEEKNLYYVAMTRARMNLYNAQYDSMCRNITTHT